MKISLLISPFSFSKWECQCQKRTPQEEEVNQKRECGEGQLTSKSSGCTSVASVSLWRNGPYGTTMWSCKFWPTWLSTSTGIWVPMKGHGDTREREREKGEKKATDYNRETEDTHGREKKYGGKSIFKKRQNQWMALRRGRWDGPWVRFRTAWESEACRWLRPRRWSRCALGRRTSARSSCTGRRRPAWTRRRSALSRRGRTSEWSTGCASRPPSGKRRTCCPERRSSSSLEASWNLFLSKYAKDAVLKRRSRFNGKYDFSQVIVFLFAREWKPKRKNTPRKEFFFRNRPNSYLIKSLKSPRSDFFQHRYLCSPMKAEFVHFNSRQNPRSKANQIKHTLIELGQIKYENVQG